MDKEYGGAYLELCGAEEKAIRTEELSACFDVACVSNTLLLNDEGIPSCRAEELLREIESLLGVSGCLEITGKYTDVYKDFHSCSGWEQDSPVIRCLKAMEEKLKSVARMMAALDRNEYRSGVPLEDLVPTDLLQMMKETYAPGLDDETVVRWYREGLEDEQDV